MSSIHLPPTHSGAAGNVPDFRKIGGSKLLWKVRTAARHGGFALFLLRRAQIAPCAAEKSGFAEIMD
jgi:hypothetical protein